MTIMDFLEYIKACLIDWNATCEPGGELTFEDIIQYIVKNLPKQDKQTKMSEVKTLQLQDLVLYSQGVPPLPAEKQTVWNLMGQSKAAMDQALQRSALEIQPILANWATMAQPALEKAISDYKEVHKKMVETRKGFTKFMDAAIDMCMGVERTWDPKTNEVYKSATAQELKLREEAHKTANAANLKSTEEQMFRQFVVNEYGDMVKGYKTELLKIIQQAYNVCLEQKTPEANTPTAMNAAAAAMRDVRPRAMGKFERKILTDAEAMKLFEAVTPPNWQNAFNDAIEYLKAKFKTYGNDLASPDKALEAQKGLFEKQQAAEDQTHQAAQAANQLLAQATIPLVTTPAGMKPIIETTVIEIPTVLDWEWEARIISAFLAHMPACKGKVRTKKGGQLTTEQMAKALDAAGVQVEGIKYADLKK